MDRLQELMKILEEEYGITTVEQLDRAIEDLGKLDISPFVMGGPKSEKEIA